MLEHIWRSIHSPDYFPSVLEWMIHILLNPFMVMMCLMVGALAGTRVESRPLRQSHLLCGVPEPVVILSVGQHIPRSRPACVVH